MKDSDVHEDTSEAAIFARVWETENGHVSPKLAREIVRLGFSEKDKTRMRELAVKNRQGSITRRERRELDNFIKVGDMLAILQSKARKLLKAKPA